MPPAMTVDVELFAEEAAAVTRGSPILVQVRDTALQDAPATILGETRGTVIGPRGALLAKLQIVVRELGNQPTIWAYVDIDGDGRVSRGDLVTVQSFPVPPDPHPRVQVILRRV